MNGDTFGTIVFVGIILAVIAVLIYACVKGDEE